MNADLSILTKQELADYLKVELKTVRHLLYTKQLPGFRVGREYRFVKSEIDKWIIQRSRRIDPFC